MTTITTHSPAQIADVVAATFDRLFATIDGWRDDLQDRIAAGGALTAEALDPIVEASAVPALAGDTLVTGAGFVAAPGALADAEWHLAWWLGSGGLRRLATIDDPAHEQFRDYTALEWWRVPAQTGQRHLTGPYVDYVCTDDYTITITTPVVVEGRMIGVIGTDQLVDRLERELLPLLRSGHVDATIVNASGRVVTATDARREPGSILRLEGLPGALATVQVPAATPPAADASAGTSGRWAPASTSPIALPSGASVRACGDTSLALVVGA